MRSPRVRVITFIPCTCCIYPSKTGQYRTSVCSGTLSISMGLVCSFCPSGRDFAAGFLQIPPRDGHPCLKLTLLTAKCVRDFHPIVMTHAGRTEKIKSSMNMAVFINTNKSVTFEGIKLHLFYPSGSEFEEDKLFEQNIFSVVQELPYSFKYEGKQYFSFRPDLSFFLNGIFLGYSE